MKKTFLYMASVAVVASLLSSCGNDNRLAKDIEGTWQANPAAVATSSPGIMTMTDTWTFTGEDSNATGGTLLIASLASVEWPLAEGSDTIAPQANAYAVSVSASVNINATWNLDPKDPDDEILVSIDPKSIVVSIDPAGVAMSTSGSPAPLDSIPPYIYGAVKAELTKAVQARFFPVNKLEDVEINGNKLKFEVPSGKEKADDVKVNLTRQTGSAE